MGSILGALLQWFLGLFGKSDAQKLQQQVDARQTETIKDISDGKKIETQVMAELDGAADDWLHKHSAHD